MTTELFSPSVFFVCNIFIALQQQQSFLLYFTWKHAPATGCHFTWALEAIAETSERSRGSVARHPPIQDGRPELRQVWLAGYRAQTLDTSRDGTGVCDAQTAVTPASSAAAPPHHPRLSRYVHTLLYLTSSGLEGRTGLQLMRRGRRWGTGRLPPSRSVLDSQAVVWHRLDPCRYHSPDY